MSPADGTVRAPRRWALLIPLAAFLALAGVFLWRLQSGADPQAIPSALIGRPAPAFDLPPLLDGKPGVKRADLDGTVTVVNMFASWCGPCRIEHPQLMTLAGDARVRLVGVNYKDIDANARRFLSELGDPYTAVGIDAEGRAGIDWGLFGVPETFVVGRDGVVRYKHIGPVTPEALASKLRPEIERALAN